MPNTITNRQLSFVLIVSITSFTVVTLPQTMAKCAGTGSWVTLLLTGVLLATGAWLWAKLNSLYPEKMLFDYGRGIVGRAGAYFISAYAAQYFFTVLLQLDISMSVMLKTNFLPETPKWATTLAALPVLGYVAYKGVTNVARLVEIFGMVFVAVALTVHIVMLLQGDPHHILPLYNPAETGKYVSAVGTAIYSFLGVETLAALPVAAKYARRAPRYAFLTMLLISLFYILIVETSIMMVGINEIVHYNYPLIVAIRQVQLEALKVLQRFDLLYLTVGFIGLMAGMSVVYLNIVEFLCRMIPKASRLLVVALVGAIDFFLILWLRNVKGITETLMHVITYSGAALALPVPILLLAVRKVRERANKKNA